MTESAIFAFYSVFAWTLLRALIVPVAVRFAIAGAALGLLCLTKPSFTALLPFTIAIVVFFGFKIAKIPQKLIGAHSLMFAAAFAGITGPWMARNYVSIGKFSLTNEYASATLVERFAYDDMTPQEFLLAFPYCTPGIGDLLFDKINGTDAMHRFLFHTPASFFHNGRDRRDALRQQHGKLDPLIGGLVRDEMQMNWWRYLLVNIPLAWCGAWPGGIVTLLLLLLFIASVLQSSRAREPLRIY